MEENKEIKKDKDFYMNELPSFKELDLMRKGYAKAYQDYSKEVKDPKVPRKVRDLVAHNNLPKAKERFYFFQLACDMCVKAYLLGKENANKKEGLTDLFKNEIGKVWLDQEEYEKETKE